MQKQLFKYFLLLMLFVLPTQTFAFALDLTYFHYENSSLIDSYKLLSDLNDVFENYFNFDTYIKWIIFGFLVSAIVTAYYVIIGKEDPIVLFEKFIYKDPKQNILVTVFLIVFGYFLLVYPVPVIQVTPIVSYSNNNGNTELQVQAWLIDKNNSSLGTDDNGNIKLLHVPMLVAIPLTIIEHFVYGFPGFSNLTENDLILDPNTQRKALSSSWNTDEYNELTASGAPCDPSTNTSNVANSSCLNAIANYKPNTFSFLGNLNNSSAKIFVNVAEPFKEFSNILSFQESFLKSLTVQQDTQALSDKLKKNASIFNTYFNDEDNFKKYFDSIQEAYAQRVSEINKILIDNAVLTEKMADFLSDKEYFSAYFRAFVQQLTLSDMQQFYLSNVVSPDHKSPSTNATPIDGGIPKKFTTAEDANGVFTLGQSAILNRNYYAHNVFTTDELKQKYNLFTTDYTFNITQSSTGTNIQEITPEATINDLKSEQTLNNIRVQEILDIYNIPDINTKEIIPDGNPFEIDNNFSIKFNTDKLFRTVDKTPLSTKIVVAFWDNYKTKVFDAVKSKISSRNVSNTTYYQPDLTLKILKNLGIDTNGLDLVATSNNLIKVEKLSTQLFFLDLVIGFLNNKTKEMHDEIFDKFRNFDIKKVTPTTFSKEYSSVVKDLITYFEEKRPVIMGLVFDDYSFNIKAQSGNTNFEQNSEATEDYGNNMLLLKIDSHTNDLNYIDNGIYEIGQDNLYAVKSKHDYIRSFLCEDLQEADLNGMCLVYIENNSNIDNNNFKLNSSSVSKLISLQKNMIFSVLNSGDFTATGVSNFNDTVSTNNMNIENPCQSNSNDLECAKFEKQEILKNTSSSIISPLTNTDGSAKNIKRFEAISYIYSGLLRDINYKINQIIPENETKINHNNSRTVKAAYNNPICTPTKEVKISGAEAYNNLKQTFEESLLGAKNYIGVKLNLYVDSLSAFTEEKIEIGNPSWSYDTNNSVDPYITFNSDFENEVLKGMDEAVGVGVCSSNPTEIMEKALCDIREEFKTVSDAQPDERTFEKQLDLMVSFLATKNPMNGSNTDLLTLEFEIYANIVQSFYNRSILLDNRKSFAGITKISPFFNMVMGGNFTSFDNRNLEFKDILQNKESYKETLSLTEEICLAPTLATKEKVIEGENSDGKESGFALFDHGIFEYVLAVLLGGYLGLTLMIPFLLLLGLTYIATILGWLGVISISYIAILNIIVFRNFKDLPIVRNEWYEPSKKMIMFFAKMVLISVLLYVYLAITVFMISNLLVPMGENMTLSFILRSMVSNDSTNLGLFFYAILFLISTIYIVFMRVSITMVKDFFVTQIVDPVQAAKQHAEEFAKKLSK